MVILLVALIVRGVSFEYRGKRDSARWRATWDGLLVAGSLVAPFMLGVALGDLLHGVPINASQEFTGTLASLFQPYGIFTGITLVLICILYGATFLGLKTTGEVRDRAVRLARRIAPVVFGVVLAFAFWTHATATSSVLLNPVEFAAVLAALAAVWFAFDRRAGWAFAATTVTMATSVLAIFVDLYPECDGVQHQPGVQPHRAQHRVAALHAGRHDDHRGDRAAVRAKGVSEVIFLGIIQMFSLRYIIDRVNVIFIYQMKQRLHHRATRQ